MAKLSELLKGGAPADFVSMSVWARIGEPYAAPKYIKARSAQERPESTREIFRAGQGQSVRKRVRAKVTKCGEGSYVAAIRVGTYTACVCKCMKQA